MILIGIIAAIIAVVTIWFLARAVRRAPAVPAQEDREALMQLRDRLLAQLRELDVEEGDRNVDIGVAADERKRLESELAQVLRDLGHVADAIADTGAESSPQLWLATVFMLALLVPLVSASLYLLKNGSELMRIASGGTQAPAEQAQTAGPGSAAAQQRVIPPFVYKMVARLEARLKQQPNDPQGWARLARSYGVLGRKDDARRAYVRAYQLAPDDSKIVAAYAGFLITSSPGHLSPEAVKVFQKLHKLEPKHPGALWALGYAAYQDKKFPRAVKYWEQLLTLLPPNNEAVPQLKHALSMARAEAAKKGK